MPLAQSGNLAAPSPPLARVHEFLRCMLTDVGVETVALILTIITTGIALAVQRRWDMKLMNRRFDDVNKRFGDVDKRFDDVNKRLGDVDKRFGDMHSRFDDVNKRLGTIERQQRKDSVALAAMGRDVAQLAGRVDELAALVSSAFQAAIGVVIARRDRKGGGSSVARQAPFRESGSSED